MEKNFNVPVELIAHITKETKIAPGYLYMQILRSKKTLNTENARDVKGLTKNQIYNQLPRLIELGVIGEGGEILDPFVAAKNIGVKVTRSSVVEPKHIESKDAYKAFLIVMSESFLLSKRFRKLKGRKLDSQNNRPAKEGNNFIGSVHNDHICEFLGVFFLSVRAWRKLAIKFKFSDYNYILNRITANSDGEEVVEKIRESNPMNADRKQILRVSNGDLLKKEGIFDYEGITSPPFRRKYVEGALFRTVLVALPVLHIFSGFWF